MRARAARNFKLPHHGGGLCVSTVTLGQLVFRKSTEKTMKLSCIVSTMCGGLRWCLTALSQLCLW